MKAVPGSTNLDEEQQEWFVRNRGVRYYTVQQEPYRPSRRIRRHGPRTEEDRELLLAQAAAKERLRQALVRPA